MKKDKSAVAIIIGSNILGIICLVYYALPYLTHNTIVKNPDAMLPVEAWDAAGMALTLGLIPLIVVNILGFIFVTVQNKILRLAWLLPGVLCFVLVVSYWVRGIMGV